MAKQKFGQEPAMPCITKEVKRQPYERIAETVDIHNPGMSKRLLIAKDVLCGILSNAYFSEKIGEINTAKENMIPTIVKMSYEYADELLKQEGE